MKKLFLFSAVIVGVLSSLPAQSQQLQNKILIEEATNASCPPCAEQNPYFDQYLQENADDVIGISYHASWPGANDPMYLNDQSMNNQRISYYGFDQIGVPTCVINGKYAPQLNSSYKGAPGDLESVDGAVQTAKTISNPYSISIQRFTQNDSEQVQIVVSSTAAVSNAYLRVVVVEAEHEYEDAGTNGETLFPHIARKMLPNYKGTKFSLDAAASKTFSFKYKYNEEWTTDALSIVAFVQTDADKTVGTAVQSIDPPQSGFQSDVKTYAGLAPGFEMHVVGVPLSSSQKIVYTLGGNDPTKITFSVVDLLGRQVQAPWAEFASVGEHSFNLRTADLASGMYRVVARTPNAVIQVPVLIGQ